MYNLAHAHLDHFYYILKILLATLSADVICGDSCVKFGMNFIIFS